jgi:hypothetical protein
MKKIFSILLTLGLVLSFSLVITTPVMAQSWLSGWSYRVEITIHSDKIDGALADFPVLLYISTSSGIDPDDVSFVFDELGAEKLKLAVTTGDGTTQCYVEIEKWDDANEQAWLWVKVPSISSSTNTTLYLYYDSTQPDNSTWVGETGTTPAQNVWDSDFVFVCHMRDDPDVSHIRDSTANVNHGTKKGGGEPAVTTAGQIDGAQNFDGIDDYIQLTNESAFDMQTAITVEGWVRLDNFTQPSTVASKWRNMGVDLRSWLLTVSTAGEPRFYISRNGVEYIHCPGSTLSTLMWYHLAGTYGDGYIRLFANSSPATPVALSGNVYLNNEPVLLGANDGWGGTARKYTDGIIDEVRISDIARSAAWIKATYHSGDDNLLSYGSQESPPPPSIRQVCGLIIRSNEGGRVTKPGEGHYVYDPGTIVKLVATPDDGYRFVEWTHDVRRIDDVNAASTTITMDYDYVIIANFVTEETATVETEVQYELTISSTMGGSVSSPGEGTFPYIEGTVVSLMANPTTGYKFVNWTGDGITNADSTTTTVTMNGDYAVKANFEFEQTTTADPTEGSSGPLACFIATAAYGTPTAEQIDVLREFRDVVLLKNSMGSQFVDLYYRLSPPVADFIAGNSFLRTVVRELVVDLVVWVVEATGVIWRN